MREHDFAKSSRPRRDKTQHAKFFIVCGVLISLISGPTVMNGAMLTSLETLKDSFDKILVTFGSCGVGLPSKEVLNDICYFNNNDSEEFKRLALLVHCCVSTHFGHALTDNCRSLANGGEVALVESEISLQNLDEYHQHSTCLLGFCMYFNSVEQSELIKVYQKNIEEVQKVLESQTSEIASIAAKIFERSSQAMRKTEQAKTKMKRKAQQMKRVSKRSRAILSSLSTMRANVTNQHIQRDWKRYASVDWLLGPEGLLLIWLLFMIASYLFCTPQFQRYKTKFSAALLICTVISILIERLTLLCSGTLTSLVDPFRLKLILKGVNLVLFLQGLKQGISSHSEMDRITKLIKLKQSCDEFSKMSSLAFTGSHFHSSMVY